jgi:hypothetical protein
MRRDQPSFDDMRVEVVGTEVRIVFMADTETQVQRIGRSVAAKVKAARADWQPCAGNDDGEDT